jgi:chromosome transmission fidelity protein 4
MVWNNVGIVKCFGEEGDQSTSSIEVEFHDSSIHHGLHIPNTLGHTMASLSSQALLLACPAQEDSPSRIVCVNFAAWDGHKEWATTLPLGEDKAGEILKLPQTGSLQTGNTAEFQNF